MDAADRIPLLERELLRIQNELREARRETGEVVPADQLLRHPLVIAGVELAAKWSGESGDYYWEQAESWILEKLGRELEKLGD